MFHDRTDAGRHLADKLRHLTGRGNVVVLALPRGGVPIGYEVARALGAPLDIFLVRKLGVPGHEELAMGAIASGGVRVVNRSVVRQLDLSDDVIDAVAAEEGRELLRREEAYRDGRPAPDLRGKVVILVDDGLATGSTMRAAVAAVRQFNPTRVIVAVPVGPSETCAEFRRIADEVVCAEEPEPFYAVGSWYADFSQTTDEEVRDLLARATKPDGHLEPEHAR